MSIDTYSRDQNVGHAVERKERRKERAAGNAGHPLSGTLWFGGWLFTIGFLHLVWWKALLALVFWPYFIGTSLH